MSECIANLLEIIEPEDHLFKSLEERANLVLEHSEGNNYSKPPSIITPLPSPYPNINPPFEQTTVHQTSAIW